MQKKYPTKKKRKLETNFHDQFTVYAPTFNLGSQNHDPHIQLSNNNNKRSPGATSSDAKTSISRLFQVANVWFLMKMKSEKQTFYSMLFTCLVKHNGLADGP